MPLNWLNTEVDTAKPEDVLKEVYGFDAFRPGQREVIEATLRGQDVMDIAPTGSGKSLTYQVPALMAERGRTTLVASPLLALMRDQAGKLRKLGIPVVEINSQVPDLAADLEKIKRGEVALAYASPEQLVRTNVREALQGVADDLVADEAHCISEWGHDFRPEFRSLGELRGKGVRRVSAHTATASRMVASDIKSVLKMRDAFEYRGEMMRDNLGYHVEIADKPIEKRRRALGLINAFASGPDDAAIVYCATRKEVDSMQQFLAKNGVKALPYHGEHDEHQRKLTEEMFMKGEINYIVATNAFGMGIDKPNIRLIVHLQIPGSVGQYLQETGRAGRDGEDSQCVLIYSTKDERIQDGFIEDKAPDLVFVRKVYDAIVRQEARSKQKVDKYFPLNMIGLYASFESVNPDTKSKTRRDTEVNVALKLLKDAKIIEEHGGYVSINPFDEESDAVKAIQANSGARKDVAEATFGQMKRYAQAEDPDQRLLWDLMNEQL